MTRSRIDCWAIPTLLAAWVLPSSAAVAAEAFTKAEVGKLGKAATVFVKGTKGSGSGFCINASGLLITNEHVVSGDKEVTVVFDPSSKNQKVLPAKVLRADKKRDLALLRVEGAQELPILALGSTDQVAELSDVVICGFPLGEILAARKEYPSISINAGSITALRRQADALEFLQLDAAVNPGNSGGPVLDMGGKVVGVVVGRIRGGEQLNFAIPVEHVAEFVKRPEILLNIPVLSQSRAHEPVEFEARVAYVFPPPRPPTLQLVLRTSDGLDRRTNMALKDGAYGITIVPVPKSELPLVEVFARFKTGAILGVIEDHEFQVGGETVKFSACRQIQLQPQSLVVLTNGKTLKGKIAGIDKIPIAIAEQKLDVDLGTAMSLQCSLPDPIAEIECTLIARQDDVEVARFETRIPLGGSGPIVRSGPRQLLIEPPPLAAPKVLKALPELASDICVGGGGRYLVLNLPKLQKLAIFGVNEAAITHYIPLSDPKVVFAAGLEKVVVGVTAKGILERWDLQTGEKEITRPMPDRADLTSMAIGSASTNHVVANGVFIDLETLKPLPIKTHGFAANTNPISADGTAFGAWKTNQSPDSSISFVLEGDELKRYEEGGLKHVVPGPDGRTACTGHGVHTIQLKPWGGGPSKAGYCIPATEGNFILSLVTAEGNKSGSIALYLLNHEDPIVKDMGIAHDIHFDGWDRNPFGPWKRIFFIPRAELLVIFPESNDRLELHHFDLNEALDKSGLDYLLVTSQPPTTARRGAEFTYQVVVKSRKEGVRYKVSSGPPGLEVSPTGLVSWQVPANSAEAATDVILTISDASGQEVFHTFSLKPVSGSEPAGSPPVVPRRADRKKEPPLDELAPLLAPFDTAQATAAQESWARFLGKASPVEKNSIGIELVLIPPGRFRMGTLSSGPARSRTPSKKENTTDEEQVDVTLTNSFYLGKTEVTQGQWRAVMETTPWSGQQKVMEGDDYPANYVSWEDATEFCKKLSEKEQRAYRLPTEAEWEFACRGGTTNRFSFGDNDKSLADFAWYLNNTGYVNEPHAQKVGQKASNPFGLFDMHGNVCEWCHDFYGLKLPGGTDPLVTEGNDRVHRGGAWNHRAPDCRSARRSGLFPTTRNANLGFRVAVTAAR